MRLDGGRRHTSSFQAGFRLTEDGNKTQSYHTWSSLNNTPNCFEHFRASPPATHLWRQWWEWWRCRWRGTGSLPSCWESTSIKKKSHSAAEDHINNVHIYKTDPMWIHVITPRCISPIAFTHSGTKQLHFAFAAFVSQPMAGNPHVFFTPHTGFYLLLTSVSHMGTKTASVTQWHWPHRLTNAGPSITCQRHHDGVYNAAGNV